MDSTDVPSSDRTSLALPRGVAALDNSSPSPNVRGKRTTIFIQDECFKHRYIRSRRTSGIFERPERLHAVKLGLAAAISRIESVESARISSKRVTSSGTEEGDDLAAALARMAIASVQQSPGSPLRTDSVTIQRTCASVSLLDHPAVKYIHGDVDGDVYLENLVAWARNSQKNIREKGSEIPEGVPPLDLYLCPTSIDAIQGAIGAVCEAVDAVVMATRGSERGKESCERAFVAIRPPGHHCGEKTPCGFCFVNNVAVGAAHAHLKHGMQRIVILDIDLHHGNGTQSIVWQINEDSHQETLGEPGVQRGPRIFYGSLHDVLSYPCEDGKPEMVQAASTSIHGPHGQYIENIHLQPYDSETYFWDVLYIRYLTLLDRARSFLDETGGAGDDVVIFISCGFDAGEHEYSSMSRHNRRVPVGFYHRFTRETCRMADAYAHGRVVSVLEGGYSDRTLISGAMAHLCGLVNVPSQAAVSESDDWVDPVWWDQGNLAKIEEAAKFRKSTPGRARPEGWLTRTLDLFMTMGGNGTVTGGSASSAGGMSMDVGTSTWVPPKIMTLRERKKPVLDDAPESVPAAVKSGYRSVSTPRKPSTAHISSTGGVASGSLPSPSAEASKSESSSGETDPSSSRAEGKRLPRVILHVRPPETTS